MLPGDAQWNYAGELDELFVYARSLTPAQLKELYVQGTTAVENESQRTSHPNLNAVFYPNPFKTTLNGRFETDGKNAITVEIYNVLGQRIRTVQLPAGNSAWQWDGRDGSGYPVATGLYWIRAHTKTRTVVKRVLRLADESAK